MPIPVIAARPGDGQHSGEAQRRRNPSARPDALAQNRPRRDYQQDRRQEQDRGGLGHRHFPQGERDEQRSQRQAERAQHHQRRPPGLHHAAPVSGAQQSGHQQQVAQIAHAHDQRRRMALGEVLGAGVHAREQRQRGDA